MCPHTPLCMCPHTLFMCSYAIYVSSYTAMYVSSYAIYASSYAICVLIGQELVDAPSDIKPIYVSSLYLCPHTLNVCVCMSSYTAMHALYLSASVFFFIPPPVFEKSQLTGRASCASAPASYLLLFFPFFSFITVGGRAAGPAPRARMHLRRKRTPPSR